MTEVHVYLAASGGDVKAATVYTSVRRGRLTSVLGYEPAYLARSDAYSIDPAIPLMAGSWPSAGPLPRALLDAAPDRWGRMLIDKREAAVARKGGRATRRLTDQDYLLGVSDATRQGALRFALTLGGAFQHPARQVPKLVELPKLLRAADQATQTGEDAEDAVKALLSAGSASLGGARPKAAVSDGRDLLIAKFPHSHDRWDVMAWEAVGLALAAEAGIEVPETRLARVADRSVLLSRRFDREGSRRVPYISALTAVPVDDAAQADYLDVAEALGRLSADPSRDLAELWRRIAFTVAVHNTDDHLRNMGLLRAGTGWRLAPAFDINPTPDSRQPRVTPIGGALDTSGSAAALLEHAQAFGLTAEQARVTAREVAAASARWVAAATMHGLDSESRDRFAAVFTAGAAALRAL
ncbi:MAG: HipA domain-containing protein [Bifidobacteriaceae bacterium]|jgi:serine/threonine-protein kinase HipA|nr:HipA domain-containing protein [Bifidobacteriaceae bacterium]